MRTVSAALVAAVLAAGCGGEQTKAPEAAATLPATTALRDALIQSALKARLTAAYPDTMANVGVTVSDGVVTLRGAVRDPVTRRRVVADAGRSTYVQRVVDRLRVDPRAPRVADSVGDVALATRVQAALTAQLGFVPVTVRVDRAVATLSGTVPDAKTKVTLLATARGTTGIRNVVDRVRVAGP